MNCKSQTPCSVLADACKGTVKYLREVGESTRGESSFPSAEYADAMADGLEYGMKHDVCEAERLRALLGKMKEEWTQYYLWGKRPGDALRAIEHLIACGLDPAPNPKANDLRSNIVEPEAYEAENAPSLDSSLPVCSAPDPADFIPPWPCQQLHGGRPPYIYQGCDPDTGLCHHPECNPANDDRVPNDLSEGSDEETR